METEKEKMCKIVRIPREVWNEIKMRAVREKLTDFEMVAELASRYPEVAELLDATNIINPVVEYDDRGLTIYESPDTPYNPYHRSYPLRIEEDEDEVWVFLSTLECADYWE